MGVLSPYVAPCLAYSKTIMPACCKDHLKIKVFKSKLHLKHMDWV